MTGENSEKATLVALAAVGLAMMLASPRKTWRLVARGEGWYDQ